MGKTANLSPMGLFNWDNSIFDLMEIPQALDRETLINNLLAETIELEVLYPNPVVFKNLLGVWSRKELDIWNRLWETTQYEYNPIENYNRYETGSESGNRTETLSGTDRQTNTTTQGGKDTTTDNLTQGGMDTHADHIADSGEDSVSGEKKNGHWIAGFNSTASGDNDGLVKQTRDEEEGETTTEYGKEEDRTGNYAYGKTEAKTGSITYGKTETDTGSTTYGKQVTTGNDGEHELHAHGNIGVTTTQEMIRQQREVDRFNLYDIIIEDFKMRFCILVY